MCNLHVITEMSFDTPTQKFGYLDIKQSSKVKGRKLKSWRRRWVVLTVMNNLSSDKYAAKLDLYDTEAKWRGQSADKVTFMLENVTCIQTAKSKTHHNAFEIVESLPVLVLSGFSDLESYSWMLTLQQIFTPDQIETNKDTYQVSVSANEYSKKWSLTADYTMTVSPTCISLVDTHKTVISWGLSTLMRFNVEKNQTTGVMNVLVIECGPNSPTGQSCFRFICDEAQNILSAIRQSICLALAQKQNARKTVPRSRAISVTGSEKSFQHLLDNHPMFVDPSRDRSESDSSSSTNGTHLGSSPTLGGSSASKSESNSSSGLFMRHPSFIDQTSVNGRSGSELESLVESDEHSQSADVESNNFGSTYAIFDNLDVKHRRHSSLKNKSTKDGGYTIIKDVEGRSKPRSNTFTSLTQILPNQSSDQNKGANISTNLLFDSLNSLNKPAKSVSFVDKSEEKADDFFPFATMTFPRTLNKLTQETNQTHNSTLKDPGSQLLSDLNRKRASSTGDLKALAKNRSAQGKTENDYEELDELKSSVRKMAKQKKSDSPPALPARPCSKSFISQKTQSLNRNQDEKSPRNVFHLFSQKKADSAKLCTCDEIRAERLRFVSDNGLCIACGGDTRNLLPKKKVFKTSSNEELASSTSSSMSDIYTSIPDMPNALTKRRRSSDITPFTSSYQLTSDHPKQDYPISVNFLNFAQKSSASTNTPGTQKTVEQMNSTNSSKPAKSDSSDPLISFFFDDEQFNSHPMVTNQLPVPMTPATNVDLLASNNPVNFSPTQTQPVGQNFFYPQSSYPAQILSVVPYPSPYPVINGMTKTSMNFPLSPNTYPNNFTWGPANIGYNVQYNQQLSYPHQDYMTMKATKDSVNVAQLSQVTANLTTLNLHGDKGDYVSPSGLAAARINDNNGLMN
ncbi:uncharacterized protein LOC131929055 [Physella acuta]|uniref:uncharacterized protein LOC131929055 n=1 Tax=Physella acuta TaxID=109671 RepID=UPI0027DC9636|nr:uncharacterized protein LOC131929055 [Physella acuta]